ncbi:MAG TPA: hypothetical protein VLF67_00785, partial [Candidatus Saccharimonas sp.]|nr:hypothetical protein [Candidatus Saccharimonas sp.]
PQARFNLALRQLKQGDFELTSWLPQQDGIQRGAVLDLPYHVGSPTRPSVTITLRYGTVTADLSGDLIGLQVHGAIQRAFGGCTPDWLKLNITSSGWVTTDTLASIQECA